MWQDIVYPNIKFSDPVGNFETFSGFRSFATETFHQQNYQPASAVELKDRIIRKGMELFVGYGVKSITMDDLAKQLSVSKKTIYQLFANKDELVLECARFRMIREREDMEQISRQSKDAMDEFIRISEYLKRMFSSMSPSLLLDLQKHYHAAWLIYLEHRETCFKAHLIDSLNRGKAEGIFRREIDIEVMARMRIRQVELPFETDLFPPGEFDLAYVQWQFFEHFVYGISTPYGLQLMERYKKKQDVTNHI